MIFAFATSAKLFDGSVRWEAEAVNMRRASMIAERKIEELRALTADVPSGSSFANVLAGHFDVDSEYPDDPGFVVRVEKLKNTHRPVQTSGLTPTDGVHSPCSSLFTAVPTGAPDSNPPDGNPQLNHKYKTYPYTRHLPSSLQLIRVTVTYSAGEKNVRLVTLLGDPIIPFDRTPDVIVTKISPGPNILHASSPPAIYTAQVVTANGSEPKDVTILWSTSLDSTGSLNCLPLDSTGRRVSVTRRDLTSPGSRAKVQALVRYGGQEAVGLSAVIQLP